MDIRQLQPYAVEHHGVVALDVARRAGISQSSWYRAVQAGLLETLHPRVARLVGAPGTLEQQIMAAVLAAGRGAMASHRSAAYLWGIPRPAGDPIDIVLPPRKRHVRLQGVVTHRPRDGIDLQHVLRERIPATNILRTLCDLGACDGASVPGAVGHVLSSGLASVGAIDQALARHSARGRHGVVALRDALHAWQLDGKPADSVLEPAFRRLLRDFDLPPATFHPVLEGYEVDFLIRDTPLVVECDGWASHGLVREQFQKDRERDAALVAAGYVVVRLTYRDIIHRRAHAARRIDAVLRRWAPQSLVS